MSRSIYLVQPDWEGDPDDIHESVVESLLNGPRYIDVGVELWRLVDENRAAQINALTLRAFGRDSRELNTAEIKQLDELLDGLDVAMKKSWLDEQWMIRPELLEEVRRRTKLLSVGEHRGPFAGDGIRDGLSQVHALREFLKQALDRGLHLALD